MMGAPSRPSPPPPPLSEAERKKLQKLADEYDAMTPEERKGPAPTTAEWENADSGAEGNRPPGGPFTGPGFRGMVAKTRLARDKELYGNTAASKPRKRLKQSDPTTTTRRAQAVAGSGQSSGRSQLVSRRSSSPQASRSGTAVRR